jgi:hypothetical protein
MGKNSIFMAAHITSINSWLKGANTNQHTANCGMAMQFSPPIPNATDFPAGGTDSKEWGFDKCLDHRQRASIWNHLMLKHEMTILLHI